MYDVSSFIGAVLVMPTSAAKSAVVDVNDADQSVAVLSEIIDERRILTHGSVGIGRIVARSLVVAKEHNDAFAYQFFEFSTSLNVCIFIKHISSFRQYCPFCMQSYTYFMKKQYLCIVKNIKMQITSNTGLVLEGGGMRGVFTSGVLDAFMKHEVYFPYVVAVSAGACNGLSYMSHQPRRARWSNIDMLQKYDYISLKSLIVNGSIFDPELIYERFPNEFFPFDYDAYEKNPATFEVVTTNCRTGRAMYLTERHDHRRLTQLIRATSSLPLENVVVMTRNRGYRSSEPDIKIPKFLYGEYPRLRVALSRRTSAYNEQLDLVERMEDWGEIVVIRPQKPLEVGRITEDVAKLERLYEEGFQQGEQFILSAGLA